MSVNIVTGAGSGQSLGIHQYRQYQLPIPIPSSGFHEYLWSGLPFYSEIIPFIPLDGLGWDYFVPIDEFSFYRAYYPETEKQIGTGANAVIVGWQTFSDGFYYTSINGQYQVDPTLPPPLAGHLPLQIEPHRLTLSVEYFRNTNIATLQVNKPNYCSLVGGYSLDSRAIPNLPVIIPVITKTVTISYYRQNKLEPIPNLKTICWMVYTCDLVKDKPYHLQIEDCVLGTLHCSDPTVLSLITSLPTISGSYQWLDLLPGSIPDLFATWYALYDATNDNPTDADIFNEVRLARKIAATNNFFNNATLGSDLNPDLNHPMFAVDSQRSYDWHYKLVAEGIGDLVMDSPRIMAIAAVLDALNLAFDPNTGLPRVANLGHLITMIASLLGYRPEPDGTFSPAKEKERVRMIINKNTEVDPTKVGVNNFGVAGMVLRRINNYFKGNKISNDRCVIVRDIPQLLAEYQDQLNLAIGLQESSAIEIHKTDGSAARYPNQLALSTEILNLTTATNELIRNALNSSLIAQAQTSELIAALGLPTVTKTLPIQVGNKIEQLAYQGVSAHRSISQEIATCTNNVGIVIGQLI
jgi:hypothetical protein